MLSELLHRIERTEALDRVAEPVDHTLRPVLASEPFSRVLGGAWLGHRLHPMLTDIVIGAWTSASVLDALGGRARRGAARTLVGVGIVSSLPTAAAGLHDWLDYGPKVRRAGTVHAVANAIGLGLQTASWLSRRNGAHGAGRLLSFAGLAVTGAGGYLGGHLTYVLGAGVERTAFDTPLEEWAEAIQLDDLEEGRARSVDVDGTAVLLLRDGEGVRAMSDTCNHAGCSLAEGEIAHGERTVTCACHGSSFRLDDGAVLSGPAAAAQRVYETRIQNGMVEVRER